MADARIQDLAIITRISGGDLFVLQHGEEAYGLQGQTLLNWLTAAADGHGGIKKTELTDSQGLVDIYTITYADLTTSTFQLKNGDSGVYLGTGPVPRTANVWLDTTNGSNPVLKVRYTPEGQWQTIESTQGEPAIQVSAKEEYQVSDSGTVPPGGQWLPDRPTAKGRYIWVKTTRIWNHGEPTVELAALYQGADGLGQANSVCGVEPDPLTHDVPLTLAKVPGSPTHRTVSDEEKSSWGDKANLIPTNVLIPTSGWANGSCTVTVPGVKVSDKLIISAGQASYAVKSFFAQVTKIVPQNGNIKVHASAVPAAPMPINILILRGER